MGSEPVDVGAAVASLKRDGYAVVPDVLSPAQVDHAVERLWIASDESRRRGNPTHVAQLDPNENNVRVFDLLDLDPIFCTLIEHPVAEAIVSDFLDPNYIISNFTANIARPGSGSMMVHSDQAIVAPEPWLTPWSINIIWCLSDVRPENGATRFAPGSQRYATADDLPDDLAERMIHFEASAGSIIAMEGRMWHTSGANVTADEDRPLLFGYYTRPFVRPQWNFSASLRPEVQDRCSPRLRYRLGLDVGLNIGVPLPSQ